MVSYTVLSPSDLRVTIACQTFDRAIEMAAEDLDRGWLPISVRLRPLRLDIEQIVELVEGQHSAPAGVARA